MVRYSPKTVLITGATGDFGRAFAQRFADLGASLILHGRSQEKLEALEKEFSGVPVYALCFDLTDCSALKDAMAEIPTGFSEIDLLINNAGGALGQSPADESDLNDWLKMIEVNNSALVAITHYVLQGMSARQRGHIINIGSIAGEYPYPGGHVYCAAKAFVKQFSLALRADTYTKNIRVTNIEPGMVETQFSLKRFKGDQETADAVYAGTEPLTANDVAECVFWAASLPEHVNVNRIELMPTRQAPGPLLVDRD